MAESKKADKPIADVAQPGKTAPSPNSKSVIVTSRPIMKDPMVNEESDKSDTKVPVKVTTGVKIEPLPETEKSAEPKSAIEADKVEKSMLEPTPSEPAKEVDIVTDKPTKEAVDKPVEAEATTEPGAVEADPNKTGKTGLKQADEAATQAAEHQASVQKLIDSKRYFLPINAIEKRRSKRFVVLGLLLSVLLALAWVDIALDAGLIEINGLKPITHFFSS